MEERKFSEQELVRREKMQELIDKGIDPFGQRFDVTAYSKGIKEQYGEKTHEELEEMAVEVSVAGRIMTKRRKGKVCFMHIQDRDGQIQLYVRKDTIGEEAYEIVKKGDIGDIIGIKGTVFMTNTGECSIKVSEYTHLTKALRPLPEKFHGLSDIEERYRRRYVDLIMNEDAKKIAFTRPRIIRSIQHYLDSKNYVEVETPVLNPILGGAAARPFVTHHNTLDTDFYLRIATELSLKRLIVGGMDAVYEIGRLFRNEGMDRTHNPEFTTIEVYKAFSDLEGMMDLTEGIISNAAMEPEIVDLAKFLNKMGAKIEGAGTNIIKITGVEKLKDVSYSIMPDRIEAGTLLCAVAITGGKVKLNKVIPEHINQILNKLEQTGCEIKIENKCVCLKAPKKIKAVDIKTMPYPGFPTDMQSVFASILTIAKGNSVIVENIFENRYKYVSELKRMGAKITVEGRIAVIKGCKKLSGATVESTDLRGGAALVVAGLVAKGTTTVNKIGYILRGYEGLDKKLNKLGAKITIKEEKE